MISKAAHGLLRRECSQARLFVPRRFSSAWARNVINPSHNVQCYISNTHDPYLNLSIEHFLLENAPANSVVLFLYINRASIVVGRNQNPWLEVNLNALAESRHSAGHQNDVSRLGKIDLVRRRSGGGTVFHDHGNVNWSVICPSDIFTRDKHAEMIVRGLRRLGVARARVNERHDIVLDQSNTKQSSLDPEDMHRTPWTSDNAESPRPLKVSGSAYKLTRGRALHHATCLLSTSNLDLIPHYLRSPSRAFIKAKGVESVSSPVGNLDLDTTSFQQTVRQLFLELYSTDGQTPVEATVGDDLLGEASVKQGWDELRTPAWLYDQTPQFTFSTKNAENLQHHLSSGLPTGVEIYLAARHGQITEFDLSFYNGSSSREGIHTLKDSIVGRYLRETWTWAELLGGVKHSKARAVGDWLDWMLPTGLAARLD